MKFINKLFNFGYTLAIVVCLIRLSTLETGTLEKIIELILAVVSVIKAINIETSDNETEVSSNENE